MADKVGKVTSSFKEASKHQARDLDAVLGEMTLLQARVEMYLRWLTHRFCPLKKLITILFQIW